ncbi:MAG: hypothetical protein M3Y17_00955 [Actinomycetota bacterium]|nr:hypothetical protein [Actinomycetota bacterium]
MTTRERLHKLVDELSEQEADEALQLIAARRGDDFARWLNSLPEEDEEISEQEEAAVQEARDEIAAGVPLVSSDEIKREFGHHWA